MLRKETDKKSGKTKLTFQLSSDHPHAASSVVGDFNGWDPTANPLRKRSNGMFSTSVLVEPGKRYAFRYVYDGTAFFNEGDADAYEAGGFGAENGVVLT